MPTAARERPILFSAPMVRAILDGRKTQTRRLLRWDGLPDVPPTEEWGPWEETIDPGYWRCDENGTTIFARCPYGVGGSRLWVRETWGANLECYVEEQRRDRIAYRATTDALAKDQPSKWRPSIFMPRWASRITLKVTGVRVERLQEITEKDAMAEGVAPDEHSPEGLAAAVAFSHLWDEINGKRAPWSANPWVWVVEFRRA